MDNLLAVKVEEKAQVLQRVQQHFLTIHNKLQLQEMKMKREIEAVYLETNESIDESWKADKTLTQECQAELLQKVWADVKYPYFIDLNSTASSMDNALPDAMQHEITRPRIRFRYEFSNAFSSKIKIKNVKLSTKTDERVIIVKVRSPEDFIVHRAQDEKAVLEMEKSILQKVPKSTLSIILVFQFSSRKACSRDFQ